MIWLLFRHKRKANHQRTVRKREYRAVLFILTDLDNLTPTFPSHSKVGCLTVNQRMQVQFLRREPIRSLVRKQALRAGLLYRDGRKTQHFLKSHITGRKLIRWKRQVEALKSLDRHQIFPPVPVAIQCSASTKIPPYDVSTSSALAAQALKSILVAERYTQTAQTRKAPGSNPGGDTSWKYSDLLLRNWHTGWT